MANDVPVSVQKVLLAKSGNLCAFPGCDKSLTLDCSESGDSVVSGQICHICARGRQGPRGRGGLSDAEVNQEGNLLLLCRDHHLTIDAFHRVYTVEALRAMKARHEKAIAHKLESKSAPEQPRVDETIYSSFLPLTHVPGTVYCAPCNVSQKQAKAIGDALPREENRLFPFMIREDKLYAFENLGIQGNPFSRFVDTAKCESIPIEDLMATPEGRRRVAHLFNQALLGYAIHKGVRFDRDHHRFYFLPGRTEVARDEGYKTLTGRYSTRQVVWQPVRRATGEARNYWWHLAAGLRFVWLGGTKWAFTIRPERHITKDGREVLEGLRVGRKVTSLKARMFNEGYLGEVHFWRSFLSDDRPRIILTFGRQRMVISSTLAEFSVSWPGIPDDSRNLTNLQFEDDLFSLGDFLNPRDEDDECEEFVS